MEEERKDVTADPEEDTVESLTNKFRGGKTKTKARRNTAPASSLGHMTIRSELQKKRASINQTIGHEVELKKGAKRLIRY